MRWVSRASCALPWCDAAFNAAGKLRYGEDDGEGVGARSMTAFSSCRCWDAEHGTKLGRGPAGLGSSTSRVAVVAPRWHL
jgi:hypothetical protein